ncbi:MAG: AmmeMemoRadiSam system protein A [Anaerolineaceae bacterium]|nr:AmmeMemoRadiSam system protein A [Anaerolineaceae bacterium]
MKDKPLSPQERSILLDIARKSIALALREGKKLQLNLGDFSLLLRQNGASFVTLTISGRLRGCIGTLEAYQPLVLDVREHALMAAIEDPRFPPLREEELQKTRIEISRLTPPTDLHYEDPNELLTRLRPGFDGVVIKDGSVSATYLPQVWKQIPKPAHFLSELCLKMGAPADAWQKKRLQVSTYQVEEFQEEAQGNQCI